MRRRRKRTRLPMINRPMTNHLRSRRINQHNSQNRRHNNNRSNRHRRRKNQQSTRLHNNHRPSQSSSRHHNRITSRLPRHHNSSRRPNRRHMQPRITSRKSRTINRLLNNPTLRRNHQRQRRPTSRSSHHPNSTLMSLLSVRRPHNSSHRHNRRPHRNHQRHIHNRRSNRHNRSRRHTPHPRPRQSNLTPSILKIIRNRSTKINRNNIRITPLATRRSNITKIRLIPLRLIIPLILSNSSSRTSTLNQRTKMSSITSRL